MENNQARTSNAEELTKKEAPRITRIDATKIRQGKAFALIRVIRGQICFLFVPAEP